MAMINATMSISLDGVIHGHRVLSPHLRLDTQKFATASGQVRSHQ